MLSAKAQKSKKHKKQDKSCIEDSGLKNMCRICCSENGKVAIFNNAKYPNMPADITQFSGLDVCKNDTFPQHICHACLKLLNGCIQFKYICNLSHKRLSEIRPKQETTEIVNVNAIRDETEESYDVPSPTFSDDNMENWTCTTCNKEFQDCYTYNDHLSECATMLDAKKKQNAEINKKVFLCDVCGKAAPSNAQLLLHKTIHEHVFPHKCDQCPYRGKTVNLLRIHKKSHLVDKPYKCTQCPKATSTSSNLARHMRLAHTTERSYKCTDCDKSFFYKHAVTRHINEVHLRQGVVECDICFKIFNTKCKSVFSGKCSCRKADIKCSLICNGYLGACTNGAPIDVNVKDSAVNRAVPPVPRHRAQTLGGRKNGQTRRPVALEALLWKYFTRPHKKNT